MEFQFNLWVATETERLRAKLIEAETLVNTYNVQKTNPQNWTEEAVDNDCLRDLYKMMEEVEQHRLAEAGKCKKHAKKKKSKKRKHN